MNEVLAILDRESTKASNAADMRRVMSAMACELRAAGQRRAKRGEVVRYDGVGDVEIGRVMSAPIAQNTGRKIREAIDTLRLWGVEVQS
jgi:hypothetical protein